MSLNDNEEDNQKSEPTPDTLHNVSTEERPAITEVYSNISYVTRFEVIHHECIMQANFETVQLFSPFTKIYISTIYSNFSSKKTFGQITVKSFNFKLLNVGLC